MSEDLKSVALKFTGLEPTTANTNSYDVSGVMPSSLTSVSLEGDLMVTGITPEAFVEDCGTAEFNFTELCTRFSCFCKDFNDELLPNTPSKALEFSSNMLFKVGPQFRSSRNDGKDKAVRFRFPYKKTQDLAEVLSVRTVIVATFRKITRGQLEEDSKMILTVKQATLLAMVTFSKAVRFAYTTQSVMLMTPLCGAIFSRESVPQIAAELRMEELDLLQMMNASSSPNGHYLPKSDLTCAIVCAISSTKSMQNKGVRERLIAKVIKQYSVHEKQYTPETFNILADSALGGLPPGMDAGSLIENFSNAQTSGRMIRQARQKRIDREAKALEERRLKEALKDKEGTGQDGAQDDNQYDPKKGSGATSGSLFQTPGTSPTESTLDATRTKLTREFQDKRNTKGKEMETAKEAKGKGSKSGSDEDYS